MVVDINGLEMRQEQEPGLLLRSAVSIQHSPNLLARIGGESVIIQEGLQSINQSTPFPRLDTLLKAELLCVFRICSVQMMMNEVKVTPKIINKPKERESKLTFNA